MKNQLAILLLIWISVLANPVYAHHSGSMYQAVPIWVQGRVTGFEHTNPHTLITLEETDARGQVHHWVIEGPGEFQLERADKIDQVPEVGDFISVCAFPYKPVAELSRMYPGQDFSTWRFEGRSPRYVAGNVLVMPDGEKRYWEPHGIVSECMRSSDDQRASWVDFLNEDPAAWKGWCEQSNYALVQSNEPLRLFVEEISVSLEVSCERD